MTGSSSACMLPALSNIDDVAFRKDYHQGKAVNFFYKTFHTRSLLFSPHSGLFQESAMERFVKIVDGFSLMTIFAKSSIIIKCIQFLCYRVSSQSSAYVCVYVSVYVSKQFFVFRVRSLVAIDLHSETKSSQFESGCQLCTEVICLQLSPD